MNEVEKLKLKLKMMEISFEQINNSRTDLMNQLGNCETIIDKITELWTKKPAHWVEEMYRILK